ncbi:hypothetical protein KKG81_11990 [bacterium]|nr:hypothetical protein [bacterium]
MIKNIFLLIFSFHILYADLTDFDTRQIALQDIKKVVQNEESIARAYEQYILDKYDIPSSISVLFTATGDYLGVKTDFLSSIQDFDTKFTSFSLNNDSLSYALKNTLSNDSALKELYEGNTFRKKTYFRNNKIYFILEDAFAKHLYNLIKQETQGLLNPCVSTSSGKSCIYNNHVYVKPTYTSGIITDFLLNYHIDKFKTGPIIITSNTAYHITKTEFNSIPKGALLYDTTGAKYVKTTLGIEALK